LTTRPVLKLVKETLTVPEAAKVLGIGDTLAWQLVQTGEPRTVKLGRRRLVSRSALDDLLSGRVAA
jgi:excisionase family DNA binding protein